VLEENGFSPLEGYLSYWAHHNETVLDRVPPGRLLVVRTDRINDAVEDIARFMEISPESLDIRQGHLFRAPSQYGFAEQIDRDLQASADGMSSYLVIVGTSVVARSGSREDTGGQGAQIGKP
jgi:hypothetical protein